MILLSISIFWLSVCVDPISADPPITVEAHVGSTALLPCHLSKVFSKTPHIKWRTDNEVVFERSFDGTYVGPGYKGRVDVPEDELRKGNCSLVLKNVSVTDEIRYSSYILMTDTKKSVLVQNIKLSVSEKSEERKDDPSAPSGEADGMNLLIIITVCIMCSVLLIFIVILIWRKYQCNFTICRDSSDLRSCSSQNNRNEEDLSVSPLNQQVNNSEIQKNISDSSEE